MIIIMLLCSLFKTMFAKMFTIGHAVTPFSQWHEAIWLVNFKKTKIMVFWLTTPRDTTGFAMGIVFVDILKRSDHALHFRVLITCLHSLVDSSSQRARRLIVFLRPQSC